MRLYAGGVTINEYNDVLLILRDDSRTWAVPGGGLEAGEQPTEAAAREIEEETGVKVMPVRLVGIQYRPERPDGILVFNFRCIKRGGEPKRSPETLQVGWYRSADPPRPMLSIHRQMLENSLSHQGGPPLWYYTELPLAVRAARKLIYGYRNARRRIFGESAFDPPPSWRIGVFTVIRDEKGRVLWVRRRDRDIWNLPGGGRDALEAPWETAVRETREETGLEVRLTDLSGVYTKPQVGEMVFAFTADVTGGALQTGPESVEFAYFQPGEEPENSVEKQVERVADATRPREATLFRRQGSIQAESLDESKL